MPCRTKTSPVLSEWRCSDWPRRTSGRSGLTALRGCVDLRRRTAQERAPRHHQSTSVLTCVSLLTDSDKASVINDHFVSCRHHAQPSGTSLRKVSTTLPGLEDVPAHPQQRRLPDSGTRHGLCEIILQSILCHQQTPTSISESPVCLGSSSLRRFRLLHTAHLQQLNYQNHLLTPCLAATATASQAIPIATMTPGMTGRAG